MRSISHWSIRSKVMAAMVAVALVTLSVNLIWGLVAGSNLLRSEMLSLVRQTTLIAADLSTSPLLFDDAEGATEILSHLQASPIVEEAFISTPDGKIFAGYNRAGAKNWQVPTGSKGIQGNLIFEEADIIYNGAVYGTLHVVASTRDLKRKVYSTYVKESASFVVLLVIAAILALLLHKFIADPITRLAYTATAISESGDYSMRASHNLNDEVGELYNSFNEMLTKIEERDRELKEYRTHLEDLVAQRGHELEESYRKLQRSERLATVGTLAAGMAHEINNPLGMMLLAVEDLEQRPNQVALPEVIKDIKDNIRRCGGIIKGVLRFASQQDSVKRPLDLNEVVRRMVSLTAKASQKQRATIKTELPSTECLVLGNRIELEQVVVNLVQNSIAASFEDADILISVHSVGDKVRLIVRDFGYGMTEKEREHAFEPFYTTRQAQGGTGLGLSIILGIVRDHGGDITCQSSKGSGTIMTVDFPAAVIGASQNLASQAPN